MGKVVSIDAARQSRHPGGGGFGNGPDGLDPAEYAGLMSLFGLAREAGLALKISVQPYADGFLFRAFSAADPYYTLFEVQKIRNGRIFEYHGRVRHQLIATEMNFFFFLSLMRAEIERLAETMRRH